MGIGRVASVGGGHVALGSFVWGGGKVGWLCVLYSSLSISRMLACAGEVMGS